MIIKNTKKLYDFLMQYAIFRKFVGFSFVGVFVTLLSMSLTYLFLEVLETPLYITHVLLACAMILLSYTFNRTFVFKTQRSIVKLLLYYAVYLSGMLLGVGILYIYKTILPFKNYILSYMVIPFTMTWNFLWANRVLQEDKVES